MTNNGYKRKVDSMSYAYSNDDLLRISGTTDLVTFIRRQQRNYVEQTLRKSNSSMLKRLMFNNNSSKKPGPQTTLLSSVLKECTIEEMTEKSILMND